MDLEDAALEAEVAMEDGNDDIFSEKVGDKIELNLEDVFNTVDDNASTAPGDLELEESDRASSCLDADMASLAAGMSDIDTALY